VFFAEMDSRLRACEKIGIAGFWKTPQRHSREGGNPFIELEQALIWVPAFAGTTLRLAFQPVRRFFHTLLRGDDAAARISSVSANSSIFSHAPSRT
jgi:hypothetical protein